MQLLVTHVFPSHILKKTPTANRLTFPGIFTRFIGAGASGNVWQSTDGSHVIKIYNDEDAARNEADILSHCLQDPELAVAPFRGLYSDGKRFGIVTSYVGTAIGPIFQAEENEQRQLVKILHILHKNGIHHHDVCPANVISKRCLRRR
ncbi:hypothetical protein C8R44DRAFT_228269 [Mycena epipterygia]|nr:hypothetical protein C8R44DRAFT_228269 [Mycena epipterygia]